jgi:multipile epidermal growth factor-like domains protein 8
MESSWVIYILIYFERKLIETISLDECKLKPKLLNAGQTVFFVVIPRFMNVDIRVIIDVTHGALDIFMSPNDSSFVVSVDSQTGSHHIDLDTSFQKKGTHTLDSVFGNSSEKIIKAYDGEYHFLKYQADDLNTFINVDRKNTLVWVQGLKNRLVLTLPQVVHDLGYTKFYLILKGMYDEDKPLHASKGMVFFRQDQLHIDLFVFFSVFFSCFFLFLAACVVAWKAKQAADVRRARRRHVVEMLTMAKRPFATVTLLLVPQSPSVQRKRTRTKQPFTSTEVRPIAVEPTEDGLAAVTSVFVRLPGGRSAPARLALASSLVLLARQLPSSGRTFLRRRSLHNLPAPPS